MVLLKDMLAAGGRGIVEDALEGNYFDVLGIKPVLGSFFLAEEETRPDSVVVLGYSLWKTRYAEDPAIVGKSIEIARHPVTVIGVAPEGFVGAMPGIREDLWVTLDPLGTDAWRMTHRSGGAVWLNVSGLAERNRKIAARREPWHGSPGSRYHDASYCDGVSGPASRR
jgi:MacB-like periplasmic core domain